MIGKPHPSVGLEALRGRRRLGPRQLEPAEAERLLTTKTDEKAIAAAA